MQNLVLTQISDTEIRQLFREELETFFSVRGLSNQSEADQIGSIELAIELTGLAKPTIYGLVSERKIPHSKRGKRLYFSRHELLEWLKQGNCKTQAEIKHEAENFGQKEGR